MSNVCPKGHYSTDQDYCSECGVAMQVTISSANASKPVSSKIGSAAITGDSEKCPECLTIRPAGARYCEACRYDFIQRSSFSSLASGAPISVADPAPVVAPAVQISDFQQGAVSAPRLLLRVVVDPALYTDPDPAIPCPIDRPEKIFHLDLEENTLGRQFEGKGVHPEIVVQDPGISRRHVKFMRGADGVFSVLELGSANGTEWNFKPLEVGVLTPLTPGDQLTLGMWTRITVEAR